MRALPVGVLVSGSGSNLEAIFAAIEAGSLPAEVRLVVSNRRDAFALERASRRGVATEFVDHKAFASRGAFDAHVVTLLRARAVEAVVLAGFMRIVTPTLLDAFPDRVVNIHPALLPAFPGTHGPRQALDHGAKIAGCTAHLVDAGVDTGPILAQAAVAVLPDDTEETLAARILVEEHRLLPEVLGWLARGEITVERGAGRPRARVPRRAAS